MPGYIEITGLDQLYGVLNSAQSSANIYVNAALMDTAVDVFEMSQAQVPVQSGNLKDSGQISSADVSGDSTLIAIGYSANYATVVHERLDVRHPNGKAKYLEDPMTAAAGILEKRVQGAESYILKSY